MRRTTSGPIPYSMYFAGMATSVCGLAALNASINDRSMAITSVLLLCAGYTVSLILRRFSFTARLLELAVIATAMIVYLQIVAGRDIGESLMPAAALDVPELKLACVLLWLEVLRSFTLVSNESVTFSAIPSVVMISLAATSNPNPEIMAFFVMYLVFAVFLLAHRAGASNDAKTQLMPALRVAIATAVLALGMACLAVIPIRIACVKAFSIAMPGFARMKDHIIPDSPADGSYLRIAQGPVRLSPEVVMTVKIDGDTPRGYSDTYWRDKVFDTYTGHGWQSSTEFRPRHTTLIGKSENGKVVWKYSRLLDHPPASGRELRQTFRLGPMAGNSIYAAGEVAEILSTSRPLHQDDFNCWQGVSRHRGWTGYSVVSELPVIAPRKLRVAGKLYPQEVRIHGTQVITTTARVGDLAKKITKGLNTPYEKALAIERYLGQHYTYDLDAPAAPAGMDAVNYFLFTSERGYCDVFASAMVVMCREIGVPARLATGFSTGVYDPSRKCYLVRDMDRHAWAEVYFPDCGWVTFDPTSWTQDSSGDWLGDFGKTVQRTLDDLFGGPASMPMVIALLAVCAAIAFSPELKRIGFRRRPHGPSKLHEAAVSQYKAIRKSIRASEKHLTPLEAAASSETLPQEARTAAKRSAELFGEIRYGKRDVTTADIRELARLHGAIKAAARRTPVTTRDERRLPE